MISIINSRISIILNETISMRTNPNVTASITMIFNRTIDKWEVRCLIPPSNEIMIGSLQNTKRMVCALGGTSVRKLHPWWLITELTKEDSPFFPTHAITRLWSAHAFPRSVCLRGMLLADWRGWSKPQGRVLFFMSEVPLYPEMSHYSTSRHTKPHHHAHFRITLFVTVWSTKSK